MNRCLLLGFLVVGCGGSNSGTDTPDGGTCGTGRYLGLAPGQSWTFKTTDTMTHTVSMKTQVVGAIEPVPAQPGVSAFKVTQTGPNGTQDSWLEDLGTEVRRHADDDNAGATHSTEHYDPYRIKVDETAAHLAVGATWMSSFTDVLSVNGAAPTSTVKNETWSVIAVDEQIAVPAGSFCALHVHRTTMANGVLTSTKDFWFARSVGKVKEVGDAQTEELAAFSR